MRIGWIEAGRGSCGVRIDAQGAMERGIFGVCGPWALRNYGGTARSIRERDTFRLWIHVWERSRRGRTGELALERSLHRSMRSGSRTDLRLCGDEVGRPVLGPPSSMVVVVDLNESCWVPSGNSALGSRGSGSNSASGAEFVAVAKLLMVDD